MCTKSKTKTLKAKHIHIGEKSLHQELVRLIELKSVYVLKPEKCSLNIPGKGNIFVKSTDLKHPRKNVTNDLNLSDIGRKSQVFRGKFCIKDYV